MIVLPKNILVSVVLITYNHEKYIREAIEGILMQKTNFAFELIIGEDASIDSTREIVEEYAKKNPEIIKLLKSEKNIGMTKNYIRTLRAVTGVYIALCEGDDYWTDELKLQKQVDFMELYPQCTLCYHAYQTIYIKPDNSCSVGKIIGSKVTTNKIISSNIAIERVYARTVTILFRSSILHPIPEWVYKAPYGDYPLILTCASKGDIGYLAGPSMAVYHRGSVGSYNEKAFGSKQDVLDLNLKRLKDHFKCFDLFNEHTSYKYSENIENRTRRWLFRFLFHFLDDNSRYTTYKMMRKYHKNISYKINSLTLKFWFRFLFGRHLYKKIINRYPDHF